MLPESQISPKALTKPLILNFFHQILSLDAYNRVTGRNQQSLKAYVRATTWLRPGAGTVHRENILRFTVLRSKAASR